MANLILKELALNSKLLPTEVADQILAGNMPSIHDIVLRLLRLAIDCDAVTRNDPKSTWAERRLSIQCLALISLLALLVSLQQR